ncbi:MAG: Na+/H+ antiporter subunit E [Planctomycetota bacterium]
MTLGGNLLLAVLWAALIGPFTPTNLVVGFVLGYVVLRASTGFGKRPRYIRQMTGVIGLSYFTMIELVIANLRVTWYTVASLRSLNPAVLRVPLEPGLTDGEITLLSTLITLTPGTLTLDVVDERSALLVHFMHVDDVDEAIDSVKSGFERRVLRATR